MRSKWIEKPVAVLFATGLMLGCVPATALAAKTATTPLTGFLSSPTDQIAVPGMIAGGEVTPEGDLYTGWAEYELRFGRRLADWYQPTRTLPNPALPLLSSTLFDGSVQYTQTVFAVAVGGQPVAYETVTAVNRSDRSQQARVAMAIAYTRGSETKGVHGLATGAYRYERPVSGQPDGYYEQPGQSFSPAFRYSTDGRDIDRSGLLLVRGPALPSQPLSTPAVTTPTATHEARLYQVVLKAHGRASFTWQIPLDAPAVSTSVDATLDSLPLRQAQTELQRLWNTQEAGMMGIYVPEAKVTATYRTAITEMLASRYLTPSGWVQASNKLQYQAVWLRDAAWESYALDLAGLHLQAEQDLAFLDSFQQPSGLFISRPGQYDGIGQVLWALSEHAQLTQDPVYAMAQLGRIEAAVTWLRSVSAVDRLGLLPPSNPGDDELAEGHITGDNLWAAAGLRSAVAVATLAGRSDLAAEWQRVDTKFEGSLDGAVKVAVARTGHIPPVLDAAGGQDWGNYYAAYPVPVLAATSPEVDSTLAWARAHMSGGLPTYAGGRSLHDYLGFSIYQTELAAGDVSDAINGLYAELTHTTSTNNGWEWDIAPYGGRSTLDDMAPHGTFAGDYVALLRNLLISESASGGVQLLTGASPAWLGPGQHITVTDAPTSHGVVSFTERASAHGETLTWKSNLAPGTMLTWSLPAWATPVHSAGQPVVGRVVTLHSSSGSVTAVFGGRRPAQSYALAAASLNRAYRAHGQPAPLVPAIN